MSYKVDFERFYFAGKDDIHDGGTFGRSPRAMDVADRIFEDRSVSLVSIFDTRSGKIVYRLSRMYEVK